MEKGKSLYNKFLLGAVMLPKPLYKKMGVNTVHLATILEMKLTLDDRKPSSLIQRKNPDDESGNRSLLAMFLMAIVGFMFVIPLIMITDPATALTGYYGMMMFFLAATLISDFTSVLIDVRDNAIILPRPITARTFLLSRLLHIVVYITKLMIPMTLAGFITIGIRYGIAAVFINLLLLPLVVLFTIFLVNAAYLVILNLSTPEKFKSIITGFQVGFAILTYAGYQILPRMMDKAIFESYVLPEKWWSLLIPSAWFARAFQVLWTLQGSMYQWLSFLLAMVIPLLCIWLVIRFFAPSFNRKLGLIAGSGGDGTPPIATQKTKQHWSDRLGQWLTRTKTEEVGFALTWKLSSRLRDFKLKTYPSMGYMLVLMVLFLMPRKSSSFEESIQRISQSRTIMLSIIYFVGLFMMQAVAYMRFTEKESATWMYYAQPIVKPGELIAGAVKAILFKFYIPFFALVAMILLALTGWKVLPDVLLGASNTFCIAYINILLTGRYLPFSQPVRNQQKGGRMINNLLIVFLLGLIVMAHYVLKFAPLVTWIAMLISIALTFFLDKKVRNLDWKSLQQ